MEAGCRLGATLKQAFSTMLQHDAGWVAVLDGERFLGVLTPARLHEALRRSIDADAANIPRGEISLDTVPGPGVAGPAARGQDPGPRPYGPRRQCRRHGFGPEVTAPRADA